MTPIRKASLLWGLIGGLSFLVLLQGYELLSADRVDWLVKFGVALLVVVGAAALSYAYQQRARAKGRV